MRTKSIYSIQNWNKKMIKEIKESWFLIQDWPIMEVEKVQLKSKFFSNCVHLRFALKHVNKNPKIYTHHQSMEMKHNPRFLQWIQKNLVYFLPGKRSQLEKGYFQLDNLDFQWQLKLDLKSILERICRHLIWLCQVRLKKSIFLGAIQIIRLKFLDLFRPSFPLRVNLCHFAKAPLINSYLSPWAPPKT